MNIIITGAYGGMGQKAVDLFASKGDCVFALDCKIPLNEERKNVTAIKTDLTDEKSVKNAFETIKSQTTHIDAIVHFAGIYMLDSLIEISDEDFKRIFSVNLYGAFFVNKTFVDLLRVGGKIVIITSELANIKPLPFTGVYAIAKAALDKYAYSLKMELQLLGISVSVLRAGAVNTGMLNVSTVQLDEFCKKTLKYNCNAAKFKKIVDSVESKCIAPEKIAVKVQKILSKKNAKFAYSVNRNKLLILLSILPERLQFFIIRQVLK